MNRTDVLNALIKARGYESYLELGVRKGGNIRRITAPDRTGVDIRLAVDMGIPREGLTLIQKSTNEFFLDNMLKFDLIFVDADHRFGPCLADVRNAVKALNPGGTVVMHDVFPETEQMASPEMVKGYNLWCGECYRVFLKYRGYKGYYAYTVDCDHGLGVIASKRTGQDFDTPKRYTFAEFQQHADEWLGLISPAEFIGLLDATEEIGN